MKAEKRRQQLLHVLQEANTPISATALAKQFSVSRQVIVGDIALLRASGEEISATPRGYVIQQRHTGLLCTIACQHSSAAMEQELNLIVDQGCTVLDVIVEHPIYGQLTGPLQLANRYDVSQFIQRSQECDAYPLSYLTEGIHLHTISCPNEASFSRVLAVLKEQHILLEG